MLEKTSQHTYTVSAKDSACSSMAGKVAKFFIIKCNKANLHNPESYWMQSMWMMVLHIPWQLTELWAERRDGQSQQMPQTCVSESPPEFVLDVIHGWESWFTWPRAAEMHQIFLWTLSTGNRLVSQPSDQIVSPPCDQIVSLPSDQNCKAGSCCYWNAYKVYSGELAILVNNTINAT